MKSSYDEMIDQSQYHFDNQKYDPKWDGHTYLGRLDNVWEKDLPLIIENSQQATWETRGYKGQGILSPREDLYKEHIDLERAGMDKDHVITNLNWEIPNSLKQISNKFALDDCMERIHVQYPGQLWNLHIDKLQKWDKGNEKDIIRIFIQLTDWQMGQFWNYGTYNYHMWRAGDVTTFDWKNIPHSTANAGYHPRVTFQLTGRMTQQTKDYIMGEMK